MKTLLQAGVAALAVYGVYLASPTLSVAASDKPAEVHRPATSQAGGASGAAPATHKADEKSPGKSAEKSSDKKDGAQQAARFVPPDESEIPDNEFGKMVRYGQQIFTDTQRYAGSYVGNGMNCANCHLDRGRKADSAPLWAAYVLYPAYRKKTGQIDTIQSRIQGCFSYSMNGTPPAVDSKEMTALVSYHYWLARNAPTGVKLKGQGFVSLPEPEKTPDLARGKDVFKNNCAICHGEDGQGTRADGQYVFPPLWGKDSFNWGAGMHRIDTAAGFIKVNMPYGRFGTLSDQEAWDVALYMNAQSRPPDPRFKESLQKTRDKHHDENCLYGRTPAELAALMQKKKKSKEKDNAQGGSTPKPAAAKPASDAELKWDGFSPATAH